ncbi:MAG: SPOR domain-containing protein [Flavobacteriales bacterium]
MSRYFFLIAPLAAACPIFGQGSLHVIQSKAIAQAIQLRESRYQRQGQEIISGYRIQLYNGKSKGKALKTQARFERAHPDTPVEIRYETPEWKTLAGYYASRDKAQIKGDALRPAFPQLIVRLDAFIRIKLYKRD